VSRLADGRSIAGRQRNEIMDELWFWQMNGRGIAAIVR